MTDYSAWVAPFIFDDRADVRQFDIEPLEKFIASGGLLRSLNRAQESPHG